MSPASHSSGSGTEPAIERADIHHSAESLPIGSPAAVCLRRLGVLAGLALLLAICQRSVLQSAWQPVRIQGGSMADSLLGDHLELRCGDCGVTIRCGAEHLADERRVVCPNCGFAENVLRGDAGRRGDRVWIDRSAQARWPRRWDVVALVSADDPDYLEVKRVVGLPGELVELKDGDVWVNGRPASKTLPQFRKLAIRVHDDRFRPANPDLPCRWCPQEPAAADASADRRREALTGPPDSPRATGWQATPDGYRHCSPPVRVLDPDTTAGRWHWLAYRQWPCMPNHFPPRKRTASGPVLDHYGYNQALSRGALHAVDDLLLSFRLRNLHGGELALRMNAAGHLYEARWSPSTRRVRLFQDGVEVRSAQSPARRRNWPIKVELAHWDSQIGLAFDGRLVVFYRPPADAGRSVPENAETDGAATALQAGDHLPPEILQIGVSEQAVTEIDQVSVDRDLYYLDRLGTPHDWSPPRRLGAGEYLVLGDNVPVSRDSRQWRSPFLQRRAILGTVVPPRSAARQSPRQALTGDITRPKQPL